MAVFQHVLWGYELTYPDHWLHLALGDVEAFVLTPEALDPDYEGSHSGQILIRSECNCDRQAIEPLWNQHIAMIASLLGARQVGSAPWRLAGAVGLEAEIVLPKKDNKRLWTGILQQNWVVLHFVVIHLKEEFSLFQPQATQIISSLRFPVELAGVQTSQKGFPLPPGYYQVPIQDIIADIENPGNWHAFDGAGRIDALQAFYLREAPHFGWTITEYYPYPGSSELGFARFILEKEENTVTLGILPYPGDGDPKKPAGRVVFKLA